MGTTMIPPSRLPSHPSATSLSNSETSEREATMQQEENEQCINDGNEATTQDSDDSTASAPVAVMRTTTDDSPFRDSRHGSLLPLSTTTRRGHPATYGNAAGKA